MNIYIDHGDFGSYLIKNDVNDEDILIQNDQDFPSLAQTFGWDGDDMDTEAARIFLDDIAGTDSYIEDPGYFNHTEDDLRDPDDNEFNFNDMDSYNNLDYDPDDDDSNEYGF